MHNPQPQSVRVPWVAVRDKDSDRLGPSRYLRSYSVRKLGSPPLLFGNSPEFWLNAQRAIDIWDAQRAIKREIGRIRTLGAA